MPLSEVDKARLLNSGDIEISLLLPNAAKGASLVIAAVVTQEAVGGLGGRALAHTSYLFSPPEDGATAVFVVPRDPASRPFDPQVGIEARASMTYSCWSTLDGAGGQAHVHGWTWTLGDWG